MKPKKIFVVVDYQNDFVDPKGALPVPNADKLWANIQNKINSGDYTDIIYTFDTHTKIQYNGSVEQSLFPNIHCEFITDGWDLYKIKPIHNDKFQSAIKDMKSKQLVFTTLGFNDLGVNEFFFTKDVFDIWTGNDQYPTWFEKTFDNQNIEIDIAGVATEFCVKMHIKGLVDRGYKVNVLSDCIEAITVEGKMDTFNELSSVVNFI